jgi:tetratricopeptide (TPR) repeat protein
VVVVVDDATWADEDTVDLIGRLLWNGDPVFVVATVRPDPYEQQVRDPSLGGFGRLVRQFESRTNVVSLNSLSVDAMAQIVLARAPLTEPSVVEQFASWAEGNPLVLVGGLLEVPVIANSLEDGAYRLTNVEALLTKLPKEYKEVFREYWEVLPSNLQQLLAVASFHGRRVQPQSLVAGYRGAFGDVDDPDPQALIAEARDPRLWLKREDEEWLDRFTDPALFEVAHRQLELVLSDDQIRKARIRMVTDFRDRRSDPAEWAQVSSDARRVLLRVHVEAVKEELVPADDDAARSAIELGELTDRPHECAVAAQYAENALEWTKNDELVDRARSLRADRLFRLGNPSGAYKLLEAQLRYRQEELGQNHLGTLSTRSRRAKALRTLGQVTEAVEEFRAVLAARRAVLEPNDPVVLKTRNDLADALQTSGRVTEAVEEFRAVLAARRAVLEPNDPAVLTTRNALAGALWASGRLSESIQEYESVLAARRAVLEPNDPAVLTTRNALAGAQNAAGRVEEALDQHKEVLAARLRVLGPDHPATLTSRSNLAMTLLGSGRVKEAIDQCRSVLADRLRILGKDHPDTFTSRNNLAAGLQANGQVQEAIEEYQQALTERLRVLGPDHPATFTSRDNLAVALRAAGRVDEAIETHRAVLADRERVLGKDHLDNFKTRSAIAGDFLASSRVAEAIEEYEGVLADRQRILGLDHPDTVKTRHDLTAAREVAERAPEEGEKYGLGTTS